MLCRDGKLAHVDVARLIKDAGESARGIMDRASRA